MFMAFLAFVLLYLLIDARYRLFDPKTHRWNLPNNENKVGYVRVSILLVCWCVLWWVSL